MMMGRGKAQWKKERKRNEKDYFFRASALLPARVLDRVFRRKELNVKKPEMKGCEDNFFPSIKDGLILNVDKLFTSYQKTYFNILVFFAIYFMIDTALASPTCIVSIFNNCI